MAFDKKKYLNKRYPGRDSIRREFSANSVNRKKGGKIDNETISKMLDGMNKTLEDYYKKKKK